MSDVAPDAGVDAAPDLTAPIGVITPGDGAGEVERNAVVQVTFDEALDPDSVDATTLTLSDGNGLVPGAVTYEASSNTVVFTPSRELSMLGSYTASMTTGPTDLAGNQIEEILSSSFAVRDGAWGTEAVIEDDALGVGVHKPQIAFDGDGNAIAVWSHNDDASRFNLWSARYTAGVGWGPAALIESDDSGDAFNPEIAIDGNGNAIALWRQGARVWANRYTPSGGWGTAAAIEENGGFIAEARLAVSTNGDAIAVWREHDGTRNNIWSNNYIAGEGWGSPILLENDNAGNAAGPQIAMGPTGDAFAVWRQNDGTLVNMMASRFVVGAGWGAPMPIESNDAGNAIGNHVAMDAAGNALVVWRHHDGTRFDLWSNRFTVDTGWGSAELIESNLGDPDAAQVAFDSTGAAIAVWHQRDGADVHIWANRYTPANGWSGAARLEDKDVGYSNFPKLAIAANGTALVVWYRSVNVGDHDIYANRYTSGDGWQGAVLIESDESGYGVDPDVALDDEDNALVLWAQWDGTSESLLFNRFN